VIESTAVALLERLIPGPQSALRGELVASHMMGLFLARNILQIQPIASLPDESADRADRSRLAALPHARQAGTAMTRLLALLAICACARGQEPARREYQGVVELHERTLSFEVPGRVKELRVRRGERVAAAQCWRCSTIRWSARSAKPGRPKRGQPMHSSIC